MSRLGDKNEARRIAREAGVPVVPGSEGLIRSEAEAVRLAHEIGFPVLIKATAGGGGRGMRVAANDLVAEKRHPASRRRGRSRVRQCRHLSGTLYRTAAARRSATAGRPSWQRRPSLGTRLLRAATASKADRGKSLAGAYRRKRAPRCAKRPSGSPKRPATPTPARANSSSISRAIFISSKSTPEFRSSIQSPKWSPAST